MSGGSEVDALQIQRRATEDLYRLYGLALHKRQVRQQLHGLYEQLRPRRPWRLADLHDEGLPKGQDHEVVDVPQGRYVRAVAAAFVVEGELGHKVGFVEEVVEVAAAELYSID